MFWGESRPVARNWLCGRATRFSSGRSTKQKACKIAGFPFIWLETFEQIDGTSILDAMIGSLLGGKSYSRMIESGYLHWEVIYDFPPFVKMNRKYGRYARIKACVAFAEPVVWSFDLYLHNRQWGNHYRENGTDECRKLSLLPFL